MEKNGMTLATDIKVAESQDSNYNLSDEIDELSNQVKDKLSDANQSNTTLG